MDTSITVALIALVASIGSAIVAFLGNRRIEVFKAEQETHNVRLKADIDLAQAAAKAWQDQQSAEQSAWREYRFEALKRLYTNVQPLLFQMRGALQQVRDHTVNLARASRDGLLEAGKANWMNDADYYLATMYRFMLPAAYQRLMEEHLALVDLSLDPTTALVYALLTEYLRAWRSDFDIATTLYGSNVYAPLDATPDQLNSVPALPDGRDARQGLLVGWRDTMVEQLIGGDDKGPRLMRFNVFVNEVKKGSGPVFEAFAPLAEQMQVFHPARRPVQWVILLILAGLAELTEWVLDQDAPADPAVHWMDLARDPARWEPLSFRRDPSDVTVTACRPAGLDRAGLPPPGIGGRIAAPSE